MNKTRVGFLNVGSSFNISTKGWPGFPKTVALRLMRFSKQCKKSPGPARQKLCEIVFFNKSNKSRYPLTIFFQQPMPDLLRQL
jgi:hypothetical protein